MSNPRYAGILALLVLGRAAMASPPPQHPIALQPSGFPVVGVVEDRYQSYNIEMVEVMGGKWWAPYAKTVAATASSSASLSLNAAGLQYQPPIDLANPRLRTLAAALSPAYVRVSDTWANTMYFQDSDASEPGKAPAGFGAVLTGPQWKGMIDFSNAIDAKIVTSFSIGAGTRDAAGVWTPSEAAKILAFTKREGGNIAAAEFFNEPIMAVIGGAPKGYTAADYGRDFKVFRAFVNTAAPAMKVLGPGPIGEGKVLGSMPAGLKTTDMLQAEGPGLDAFTYHFYGAVSQRCVNLGAALQTTPEAALSKQWLFATQNEAAFYGALRDKYEPGKPLWLSETADAACGGNPWAASYIDSFRYLNQLGLLAKHGVRVTMHNTLTGDDYGLIDRNTLTPRPNYWAAVLWRRLMGTTVLDAGESASPNLYVYAHCLRGQPGGVAMLILNANESAEREISLPVDSIRYTLSASSLISQQAELNGHELTISSSEQIPAMVGEPVVASSLRLEAATITFLALPAAHNPALQKLFLLAIVVRARSD